MDNYRPVADVTFNVTSADGADHDVAVFFEISGQLVVDSDDAPVIAARGKLPSGAVDLSIAHVAAAGGATPALPFGLEPHGVRITFMDRML